jgi:hypothetical protein
MSLKDEGFRYLVHRIEDLYGWRHPAEVPALLAAGWVDCTDMTDAELEAFFRCKD